MSGKAISRGWNSTLTQACFSSPFARRLQNFLAGAVLFAVGKNEKKIIIGAIPSLTFSISILAPPDVCVLGSIVQRPYGGFMTAPSLTQPSFYVKNCSLAAIATGEKASSLVELRDKLLTIDEGSVYYHFWGGRMNPRFVETQHHNDFASWAYHRLHDRVLAEKLNVIDPTEFSNLEALRQEVLETIEKRLDDYDMVVWTKKEDRFSFIRSLVIVFESAFSLSQPQDLKETIPSLPPSSIFYHFIDARARTAEGLDDFSVWLNTFGSEYAGLTERFRAIDPYFLSLVQLKEELVKAVHFFFEQRG